MAKRQRDTSWELTAGIRQTGLNNLTQSLGLRAEEVVRRLHNDPQFVAASSQALIALCEDSAPLVVSASMDDIKGLMGTRCFLADEVQAYLNLQHRETTSIPTLNRRQIRHLITFLEDDCPILGNVPAAETHILFPQPSLIEGSTFDMEWVLRNTQKRWRMEICMCGGSSGRNIPDRFFNKTRKPQWFLMFWGTKNESAVPRGTDVDRLTRLGYKLPDLATYALALGYLRQRGVDISSGNGAHYAATVLDGMNTVRTVDAGLNIYPEEAEPALIREFPLE